MAAQYHFLSEYRLAGDPEPIWAALEDVTAWPEWWSWMKRVDVIRAATGPDGLGATYRYTVRAPTGYGFVYETEAVAVERLRRIDIISSGEIVGRGRLGIDPRDGGELDLWFAWLVETPKRWMTALAPIARPMFGWNHDRMMDAFGTGLARRSGARLVSSRNTTVKPGTAGFWVMPEPRG